MSQENRPGVSMPPLPLVGGCQCGQLRYQLIKPPTTLYCCHCLECQAQSASGFAMSLRAPSASVELQGEHASYFRDPGKVTAAEAVFCPNCGSRVVHRGRGDDSGLSIKAGSLDDRSWLKPVGHIWASRAQKWVVLGGLVFDHQPDDNYRSLIIAFTKQQKGR